MNKIEKLGTILNALWKLTVLVVLVMTYQLLESGDATVDVRGYVDVGNTVDVRGNVDVYGPIEVYGDVGVHGTVSVENSAFDPIYVSVR